MKKLTQQNQDRQILYMIGNAHLDPVWLWQWPDGFQEIKATFRSALDRMNEYDDFIFTSSSASYYEWIERNDHAMFEEIKQRVKDGRWVLCGGWWIQPDCNIPNGESFVRQGLYGQRYFRDKFGVTAKTGYNVDSFGHNAMLPQFLLKCKMDSYVFLRPGPHEKGLPGTAFLWQSGDGSAVKSFRIPYEYCSWGKDVEGHAWRCAEEIKGNATTGMCFYGVGNHGGGPTKQNIDSIHRLDKDSAFTALKMASPDDYFANQSANELPVVCGDLLHHASGCYSAHCGVKMWNRKAENRLMAAEKFGVLSNVLTGHSYCKDELTRGWKKVLFNQFHDILAGSSIEEAYDDARDSYGEALNLAMESMNDAAQAISSRIKIKQDEDTRPIVVFNPCGFENSVEVELESVAVVDSYALFDSDGTELPFQRVHSSATAGGRCKICFIAKLPPLGYRLYCLKKVTAPKCYEKVAVSCNTIENDMLRLTIDSESGYVKSLYRKDTEMEMLLDLGAVPLVIDDHSDTWSHNVRRYDNIVGKMKATRVSILEEGTVKSVIRVVSSYGSSKLIQDFAVYRNQPFVEVRASVDWHEKFKVLKLQFPLALIFRKSMAEIPYGMIERAMDSDEYPMQTWVDVSGEVRGRAQEIVGITFINDGKTSYSIDNTKVNLTVLRSPIYAHHDPLIPDTEGEYHFVDQGIHNFTYRLYLHNRGVEGSGAIENSISLQQKPFALFETYHSQGDLPAEASLISVSNNQVILSAVKLSEDTNGYVIRLYETFGKPASVIISSPLLQREIPLQFSAMEIKTVYIPIDNKLPYIETNLLEDLY